MTQIKNGVNIDSAGYLDGASNDDTYPGLLGQGVLKTFGFSTLENQLEAKRKEKAEKAAKERKAKGYFETLTSHIKSWW